MAWLPLWHQRAQFLPAEHHPMAIPSTLAEGAGPPEEQLEGETSVRKSHPNNTSAREASKGADCGLKGWCPALLSASRETGAEPFQSHHHTTVSLSQKISSDHSELTDLSWLQKGCLVSKNFTTHPFVT